MSKFSKKFETAKVLSSKMSNFNRRESITIGESQPFLTENDFSILRPIPPDQDEPPIRPSLSRKMVQHLCFLRELHLVGSVTFLSRLLSSFDHSVRFTTGLVPMLSGPDTKRMESERYNTEYAPHLLREFIKKPFKKRIIQFRKEELFNLDRLYEQRLTWTPDQHLVTFQYIANRTRIRTDECPICLNKYVNKQILSILKCLHQFHSHCVILWLAKHRSCPLCREGVRALTHLSIPM